MVDSHQVERATNRRRQQGVRSIEDPFMAPWGCGEMVVKVGAWSDPVVVTRLCALCRDWKMVVAEGVALAMEDRGHLVQEC